MQSEKAGCLFCCIGNYLQLDIAFAGGMQERQRCDKGGNVKCYVSVC